MNYIEEIINDNIIKIKIIINGDLMTWNDMIFLWKNEEFIDDFNSILDEMTDKFGAFFWETPPLSYKTLKRVFEFVCIRSDELNENESNYLPFKEHFDGYSDAVICFDNIGNNARLVVPCPMKRTTKYSNLSEFIRNAPVEQKRRLWRKTSEEIQKNLNHKPIWVNTSGLGVSWLHLRIDTRPKYYEYKLYRYL
jgi:hypothetical protein